MRRGEPCVGTSQCDGSGDGPAGRGGGGEGGGGGGGRNPRFLGRCPAQQKAIF
jgi:hypothetical protein